MDGMDEGLFCESLAREGLFESRQILLCWIYLGEWLWSGCYRRCDSEVRVFVVVKIIYCVWAFVFYSAFVKIRG